MDANGKTGGSGVGSVVSMVVSMGKDVVALLRDAALFFLGLMLVAFPGTFNNILVDAGFEEGSVVGFKWKSKLVESDQALQKAQATISELQAKNDDLVATLTQAKAQSKDVKLGLRIDQLENDNRQLKTATEQVQASVSETIEANAPLVRKVVAAANPPPPVVTAQRPKSDYTVGVQTVGLPDSERVALAQKLKAEGYGVDAASWSYPAGERPSWFAPRSTVFYYAPSALPAARELARFMKTVTDQEYVVQKGAGLGVDPERRAVTLFVHVLKR